MLDYTSLGQSETASKFCNSQYVKRGGCPVGCFYQEVTYVKNDKTATQLLCNSNCTEGVLLYTRSWYESTRCIQGDANYNEASVITCSEENINNGDNKIE